MTYGGKKGISEYFRSQGGRAMCKVFTPASYIIMNQTKEVIGCCDNKSKETCILSSFLFQQIWEMIQYNFFLIF